ncbi:MAG: AsmA family protein [Pseudomonadota bacterium]
MARILKIVAIAAGGIVALLLAVVAIVALTFNPNDYKPTVIKLVKEKTQRTLAIPGEIKLSFYPKIGADLGKISLSERNSTAEFAAIDSARVSLALIPLLSKNLVVDRVAITGIRANLVRFKDGSLNIDDLLSKKEEDKSQPIKFDIDSVKIGNASASFDDKMEGRIFALTKLNVESGQIASGVPGQVTLSANVKASKPAVNTAVTLKTGFTFDLEKKHYVLKGLDATVSGALLDYEKVDLSVAGDADLDGAQAALSLSDLKIGANAKRASQVIEAKATLPSFKGTGHTLTLPGLSIDVSVKDAGTDAKAKATGTIAADLDALRFTSRDLQVALEGKQGGLDVKGKFAATFDADLKKDNIGATLKGMLDESAIDARVGLVKGAIDFAVNIDKIDVERYQSKAPAAPATAKAGPEPVIDLSGLKALHANGSLKIGSVKVAGMQATALALELHAGGGKFAVSPMTAKLYGGSLNGGITLDFANSASTPRIAVKQDLTGVKLGLLLKDAIKKEPVDGTGDVQLDVFTQGPTVTAMRKALGGTARLRLADGSVSGFNLAQMIRSAKASVGMGAKDGTSTAADKTDFTELSGSFKIANGVAHNDDLSAKTPLFRLGGVGDIDIGRETIDYTVKATVVATLQGQGGPELQALKGLTVPVKLGGPFTAMTWHIDFAGMAGEAVKTKVQDKLKDALKGLLGR